MPSFTSGQTLSLTLDYDDVITWSGQGIATITPSTGSVTTSYLTGSQTLGPYGKAVSISIVTSSVGSYTQNSVAVPALISTDGVVSGNGNTLTSMSGYAWSSGIPFVMPSSGNVTSTSGAITATTGFDRVIGSSYTFFPAAALFGGSPAGWYYTVWSAATLATVYANTYSNGVPTIPASPTPLTTVVGAYTQTTGADVLAQNVVIPGGSLGNNGMLEWRRVINNNNSAGNKTYNTYYGGSTFQGAVQTTNPKEAGAGSLICCGTPTAQVSGNAQHGDSGNAGTVNRLTINSAVNQVAAMAVQLATATDYAIIESFSFRVTYGA